ncbi:MAG: hypothetical protein ACLR23_05295 [Clostridia bacterium]
MADRMVRELMKAGLHTLAGTAVKTYENLAKELGNYYLPGPQLFIMRLVQQMQLLQANPEGEAAHFQNASTILVQLASTIKKRGYTWRRNLRTAIPRRMTLFCLRRWAGYGS